MRIGTELEISYSHKLNLPYESKCKNLHGHNAKVKVEVECPFLNNEGMVIDFSKIKAIVNEFDHTDLSDIKPNPTAERIAEIIAGRIKRALLLEYNPTLKNSDAKVKVRFYETERNWAEAEA